MNDTSTQREHLSHSKIQLFKSCRKRYEFNYVHCIRPEKTATPLRIGTIGHLALEYLLGGMDLADVLLVIRSTYNSHEPEIPPSEWAYEREMVCGLIRGYERVYRNDQYTVLATELEFDQPIRNPATGRMSTRWGFVGKVDAIVADSYESLGVMEHKFISDDLTDKNLLWQRLEMDPQITQYVTSAREAGYGVEYVIYDAIRKPVIKPSPIPCIDENGSKIVLDQSGNRVMTATGEKAWANYDKFNSQMAAYLEGEPGAKEPKACKEPPANPWRQTASVKDGYELLTTPMSAVEWGEKVYQDSLARPEFYFRRKIVHVLDNEIEELKAEVWDVQQAIAQAERTKTFYRTVSGDTCKWCPYFSLCVSKWTPDHGIPEGFIEKEPNGSSRPTESSSPTEDRRQQTDSSATPAVSRGRSEKNGSPETDQRQTD